MTRGYIRYRGDYKYQLASEYRIKITILPTEDIATDFIDLNVDGELKVKNSYADPLGSQGLGDGTAQYAPAASDNSDFLS